MCGNVRVNKPSLAVFTELRENLVALADLTAFAGSSWLLGCFPGAACGNQTHDVLITSETLYQLS